MVQRAVQDSNGQESLVIDSNGDRASNSLLGTSAMSDDERRPLLQSRSFNDSGASTSENAIEADIQHGHYNLLKTIQHCALFLGVFLANVDTSFVLATYNSIASNYDGASFGSWILIAYNLGNTAALPTYGALSNTYGSKAPLLAAYFVFAIGTVLSASSTALWQVILGRLIAGAGGAGMTTTVAVIITENAEPSRVAVLRSYVNLMAIAGRSAGGPIGGVITDLIGWRWSFLIQVPVVALCFVSVLFYMISNQQTSHQPQRNSNDRDTSGAKVHRSFDLAGIVTFTIFLTTILLGITAIGHPEFLSKTFIASNASVFVVSGLSFILIELYYAKSPAIPFQYLKGAPVIQMLIQVLLLFAQFSVVSNVGTYFARTEAASNSVAALHLVPVAVGNAVGSLVAGQIIKRTKRYKSLASCGLLACTTGFALMAVRWRGRINTLESLYIVACSLGIGLINTTQFVAITSAGPKERTASLISFFFLSQQVGMMLGAGTSGVIIQRLFTHGLLIKLGKLPRKFRIVKKILEDTRYAFVLPAQLQEVVISSYGAAFSIICIISGAISVLSQILLILLKEQTIQ